MLLLVSMIQHVFALLFRAKIPEQNLPERVSRQFGPKIKPKMEKIIKVNIGFAQTHNGPMKSGATQHSSASVSAPALGDYTISEPVIAAATDQTLHAEFARMPKNGGTLEGLKRGTLYNLAKDNHIETVSMRKHGKIKGCKLIYLPSLRKYLHMLRAEQNAKSNNIDNDVKNV